MTPRSRYASALPYAVLAAAAGYLYYTATHIDYHHRAGTLGPDVWPKALLALLIVICLYQILKVLAPGRGEPGAAGMLERMVEESRHAQLDSGAEAAPESHPWLLAGGVALTALYVGVIQTLGFFIATVVYLAAFIAVGGYRRWAVTAAVSLGGALVLFFFFVKVVYVSLPIGSGPFAQVTFLLMRLMGIR
ncbi:MAG TPA: tripartite tricarboxylate transporter TctB family protein [Burkholderiales bacterium]|nr:tripartite tricarboxylate transporter TctB family protein [Burkholderiales bacterium]